MVVALGMPKRITGFVGSQREHKHNPDGFEDSCTVLLHYDGMLATMKAGVVSLETAQLRYWVRGTHGSYKKVGLHGLISIVAAKVLPSFIWMAKKTN